MAKKENAGRSLRPRKSSKTIEEPPNKKIDLKTLLLERDNQVDYHMNRLQQDSDTDSELSVVESIDSETMQREIQRDYEQEKRERNFAGDIQQGLDRQDKLLEKRRNKDLKIIIQRKNQIEDSDSDQESSSDISSVPSDFEIYDSDGEPIPFRPRRKRKGPTIYNPKPDYSDESDFDSDFSQDEGDEFIPDGKRKLLPLDRLSRFDKDHKKRLYPYQTLLGDETASDPTSMLMVYRTGSGKGFSSLYAMAQIFTHHQEMGGEMPPWLIVAPNAIKIQWEKNLLPENLFPVFRPIGNSRPLSILHKYREWIRVVTATQMMQTPDLEKYYILYDEAHDFRFTTGDARTSFDPQKVELRNKKKEQKRKEKARQDRIERGLDPDPEEEPTDSKSEISPKRKLEILKHLAKAKKCIMLTATPAINFIGEIASFVAIIDREFDEIDDSLTDQEYEIEMHHTLRYLFDQITNMDKDELTDLLRCHVSFYNDVTDYVPTLIEERKLVQMNTKCTKYAELITGSSARQNQASFSNTMNKMEKIASLIKKHLRHSEAKILVHSSWVNNSKHVEKDSEGRIIIPPEVGGGLKKFSEYLDSDEINIPHFRTYDKTYPQIEEMKEQFNRRDYSLNRPEDDFEIPRVMLISDKLSVGVDFKGVTLIILMEADWSLKAEEQTIARAVRERAHNQMPVGSRLKGQVLCYRFISIFKGPKLRTEQAEDNEESRLFEELDDTNYSSSAITTGDIYIRYSAIRKQVSLAMLETALRDSSIEQNLENCRKVRNSNKKKIKKMKKQQKGIVTTANLGHFDQPIYVE